MNADKKLALKIICGAALFAAGTYISADWLVYYFGTVCGIQAVDGFSAYQTAAKFSVTCMSCAIALLTGKDGIGRKDSILLAAAFCGIFIADIFMVLLCGYVPGDISPYQVTGIIFFMIVQTLFSIRHSRNISYFLRRNVNEKRKNIIPDILVLLLCIAIPAVIVLYVKSEKTTPVMLVYGAFLIFSVYSGWMTFCRGFFPKRNCLLIAIGLTLFFCCDVNVGLSAILPQSVAHNLVWIFYTPALLLLAFSGYGSTEINGK